jgi:hypothetical protein
VKKKKTRRGRPKLPWEFWNDIQLLRNGRRRWLPGKHPKSKEEWHSATHRRRNNPYWESLSEECRKIMRKGALRWVRNGKKVAEIKDWKTLRARIHQAKSWSFITERQDLIVTTDFWQGDRLRRSVNGALRFRIPKAEAKRRVREHLIRRGLHVNRALY